MIAIPWWAWLLLLVLFAALVWSGIGYVARGLFDTPVRGVQRDETAPDPTAPGNGDGS